MNKKEDRPPHPLLFRKMRIRLTLLCLAVTGVILAAATCLCLYFSESGIAKNGSTSFTNSLNSMLTQLESQNTITRRYREEPQSHSLPVRQRPAPLLPGAAQNPGGKGCHIPCKRNRLPGLRAGSGCRGCLLPFVQTCGIPVKTKGRAGVLRLRHTASQDKRPFKRCHPAVSGGTENPDLWTAPCLSGGRQRCASPPRRLFLVLHRKDPGSSGRKPQTAGTVHSLCLP